MSKPAPLHLPTAPAPPLGDALEALLPTPGQTLLLRACLQRGPLGHAAWRAWSSAEGGLAVALAGDADPLKGLLPLLYWQLQRNSGQLGPADATVLRSAHLREELRARAYHQACHDLLGALNNAPTAVIVLKGAALAALAYPEPHLRHSRDLDLLVREVDLARAAEALARRGCQPLPDTVPGHADPELRHPSGLVVRLHSR